MKKYLFILILLLTINFGVPNNARMLYNKKQNIEYVQNKNNRKDLTLEEIEVNKRMLLSELIKLYYRIDFIERTYVFGFNTS